MASLIYVCVTSPPLLVVSVFFSCGKSSHFTGTKNAPYLHSEQEAQVQVDTKGNLAAAQLLLCRERILIKFTNSYLPKRDYSFQVQLQKSNPIPKNPIEGIKNKAEKSSAKKHLQLMAFANRISTSCQLIHPSVLHNYCNFKRFMKNCQMLCAHTHPLQL